MNGTAYGREPKVWKLGKDALALIECDKIDAMCGDHLVPVQDCGCLR
jgi:hypothetical protein